MDVDIDVLDSAAVTRRRPLALAAALLLALPAAAEAGSSRSGGRAPAKKAVAARAKPSPPAARARARRAATKPRPPAARARRTVAKPPTFAQAKAAMTALMRDRAKRRYHHHWDRAIRDLLRAARGKDAAPATLEAARARYALYRWSADEADREKALVLAARAARLGSREAPALARAIRREAGEDRPARPAPARGAPHRPERPEPEEEAPAEPELEAAVADLSDAAPAAMPLGSDGGGGAARVSEVRAWSSDDYTRVAVYLSHWVGWHKLELQADPERPRRFALDLRPAQLDAAFARAVPGAQVDRVRAAQNDPETVRVVLELPGADGVEVFALDDPPRLVLDVGTRRVTSGEGASAGATEAPAPAAAATSSATAAAPPAAASQGAPAGAAGARVDDRALRDTVAALRGADGWEHEPREGAIRRIVVDAGHGGHDPGAIGRGRVREKDVTLAIARRLAKKLRAEGFEVVLTRDRDRFLALEERTAIANTARGDLFVSIHANAHPRRNRSGVETYFLDVTDDRYAARLAARENGADLDGSGEVARILTDLDAKASAGASQRLARLVQREVTQGVRARVGDVRDLGVKSALFYVLLGARMPAVLVETAFLSNRAEERRLASARYQDEVAAGISRAVSAFARSRAHVASR